MRQIFSLLYQQNGIRRLQQLMNPSAFVMNSLPLDIHLHILDHGINVPVDTSQLYFAGYSKRILVEFVEQINDPVGKPMKMKTSARFLTADFFRNNPQFKWSADVYSQTVDPQTLLISSSNCLGALYRYAPAIMTPYFKWLNGEKAKWDNIAKAVKRSVRQHLVFTDVPKDIPSVSFLNQHSKMFNQSSVRIFDTPAELFILELWKWLNPETRKNSIFSVVSEEDLAKVTLVFRLYDGRVTLLNLGYLNSWIISDTNTNNVATEATGLSAQLKKNLPQNINASTVKQPGIAMQKIFLKFLITLQDIGLSTSVPESTEEPKAPLTDDSEEERMVQDETSDYLSEHGPEEEEVNSGDIDFFSGIKKTDKQTADKKPDMSADLEKSFKQSGDILSQINDIDEELEILEKQSQMRLKDRGLHIDEDGNLTDNADVIESTLSEEEIEALVYRNGNEQHVLIKEIDASADVGMISAAEYKRLKEDALKYDNGSDPYGSNLTVAEMKDIKPEDHQIKPEDTEMSVSPLVTDKSLCYSSLQVFDEEYIKNIAKRDMVAMISNVQRAGVVIKNHEVEIDHSALGTYEIHTLELKPVDGAASTIRFKLPVVNEDGTFLASGNKYVMRKQRIDIPIRKIDPITVALTSYYGKTFVARSAKKANSSLEWLLRHLTKASYEDHPLIKQVAPGNVYDNNNVKLPFLYQAISQHFVSFKVGKYNFNFSYKEREKYTSPELIKRIEKNGSVIVGYTDQKEPLVMDGNDEIHIFSLVDDTLVSRGDLPHILQLPLVDAPVDFSEVRIFTKTIPVGIVLGYFIGLSNLLKLLKVKFRFVEPRKNKALQHDEYAITFSDGTYVFSRKQKHAALILGGFLEYEKHLKQFKREEFNHRDVYFALMESKGISSVYIREMELTDQMFVDPITRRILNEMGEPITFRGLLVRASQMLLTYSHPDSQDTNYQRFRGYERFPGAVYKDLVASIRSFRNRNLAGRSKIEMSPYQVWGTVMNDQSIKITEDINPIQQLKELEVVTYVGEGGRSKDAMNRESRAAHINDMGIMSEATVDSSDVGINAYLSANPNFNSVYGTIKKEDKEINPATIISTSALLSPGADGDD